MITTVDNTQIKKVYIFKLKNL